MSTTIIQKLSSILQRWSLLPSTQSLFLNSGNFMVRPIPQLAGGIPMTEQYYNNNSDCNDNDNDDYSIWFAVPKRKHTRSRKRMKTTSQKRLKLKKNIVFDPRTGEVTLMHKLPFNWKDYVPKITEN